MECALCVHSCWWEGHERHSPRCSVWTDLHLQTPHSHQVQPLREGELAAGSCLFSSDCVAVTRLRLEHAVLGESVLVLFTYFHVGTFTTYLKKKKWRRCVWHLLNQLMWFWWKVKSSTLNCTRLVKHSCVSLNQWCECTLRASSSCHSEQDFNWCCVCRVGRRMRRSTLASLWMDCTRRCWLWRNWSPLRKRVSDVNCLLITALLEDQRSRSQQSAWGQSHLCCLSVWQNLIVVEKILCNSLFLMR